MNHTMEIVKSLEEDGLLVKSIGETIRNEAKEQKNGFGTLGTSLLGNLLTGKGVMRTGESTIRPGQGKIRAGQDF